MRGWMLGLTAILLGVALLSPGEAYGSCASQTTAEAVDRAAVVVYGRVAGVDMRTQETFYTVAVQRIFKGSPPNPLVVYVSSGRQKITSVDYRGMTQGSSHLLYLRPTGTGEYTTDVCSGSHPLEPTADETAILGEGQPAPPPPMPPGREGWKQWIPIISTLTAFGLMGAVALSIRARGKAAG